MILKFGCVDAASSSLFTARVMASQNNRLVHCLHTFAFDPETEEVVVKPIEGLDGKVKYQLPCVKCEVTDWSYTTKRHLSTVVQCVAGPIPDKYKLPPFQVVTYKMFKEEVWPNVQDQGVMASAMRQRHYSMLDGPIVSLDWEASPAAGASSAGERKRKADD